MAIRGVAPLRSVPYFFTNDFIVPLSKILLLFSGRLVGFPCSSFLER